MLLTIVFVFLIFCQIDFIIFTVKDVRFRMEDIMFPGEPNIKKNRTRILITFFELLFRYILIFYFCYNKIQLQTSLDLLAICILYNTYFSIMSRNSKKYCSELARLSIHKMTMNVDQKIANINSKLDTTVKATYISNALVRGIILVLLVKIFLNYNGYHI
jgi:hypothetical protein